MQLNTSILDILAAPNIGLDRLIRGIEKEISFPAQLTAGEAGFKGAIEFSLNRKDFEMMYTGKADDLIRDGVVLKLTLAAK